jgi:hypothetical protein
MRHFLFFLKRSFWKPKMNKTVELYCVKILRTVIATGRRRFRHVNVAVVLNVCMCGWEREKKGVMGVEEGN